MSPPQKKKKKKKKKARRKKEQKTLKTNKTIKISFLWKIQVLDSITAPSRGGVFGAAFKAKVLFVRSFYYVSSSSDHWCRSTNATEVGELRICATKKSIHVHLMRQYLHTHVAVNILHVVYEDFLTCCLWAPRRRRQIWPSGSVTQDLLFKPTLLCARRTGFREPMGFAETSSPVAL